MLQFEKEEEKSNSSEKYALHKKKDSSTLDWNGNQNDTLKGRFSNKLTHVIKNFYSNCLSEIGDQFFLIYA